MTKNNKKLLSVILTAAIGASFVAVPTYAEAEMIIKAPQYYRVENEHALDPVDLKTEDFTVPSGGYGLTGENGQFVWPDSYVNDCIQYAPVTGNFKTVVDIENGADKDATLYVAVYDEDGKLVGANLDSKVKADAEDTLSATIAVGDNEIFKSFIWDGTTMKPLEFEGSAPVVDRFFCDGASTVSFGWENRGDIYKVYKNGVQVNAAFTSLDGDTSTVNSALWPLYVYTDKSAVDGDYYEVEGSNGVKSKKYYANFDNVANVKLGLAIEGRNMMAVKNDEIAWWYDGVYRNLIIDGIECASPNVKATYSSGAFKTSKYQCRVDPSIVTGNGNTVDITVKYYDDLNPFYDENDPYSKTYRRLQMEYYEGSTKKEADIVNTTGTNTWKEVTFRVKNMTFNNGETEYDWKRNTQFIIKGASVAEVSVKPIIDYTIKDLDAKFVYSDAAYISWDIETEAGVTGYTVLRDGVPVAQNVQIKEYFDQGLEPDTTYAYTVQAETSSTMGEESEVLVVDTLPAGDEFDGSFGWTVNADGTGADGELTLRRWYNPDWTEADCFDRYIVYNAEKSLDPVDGKTFSTNIEYQPPSNKEYQRWRNSWHYEIPDCFLYGTDYDVVKVEVEYYAPNPESGTTLHLFVNSDAADYSADIEGGEWKTAEYYIRSNDGKDAKFSNGWKSNDAGGVSDIRFMTKGGASDHGTQVYIHSVKITKQSETIADARVINLANSGTYRDAVILNWDLENGAAVTGYTIKRNGAVIVSDLNAKTYTDKDLSASTQYTYEVIPEAGSELGTGTQLAVTTGDSSAESLKTEVSFGLNENGTAAVGELQLSRWDGYDRNIAFSGDAGKLGLVKGRYCSYNEEYDYAAAGQASWKQWKNHWVFNIPDDFIYGTAEQYGCDFKIEVDCYLPAGEIQFHSGNETWTRSGAQVDKNGWCTVSWSISHTDSSEKKMSFTSDSNDFELFVNGGQGYISAVRFIKVIE